ncbi:HAD family hydrolase [Mycetocola reblochoni]|nr:HAD family hydrolase [Mycetocola reblochoni]
MDGTIVDTEPFWIECETALVQEHGGTWSHEQAMRMVGSGLWESAEVLRAAGVDLEPDDLVTTLTGRVMGLIAERGLPFRPGARELIAEFAERRVPQAIVTMSILPMARAVAALLPEGTFDTLVTGDAVPLPKPHPDPYLLAAERLGVDIADCIALEDSPTGLRAAVASGATAVAVPHAVPIPSGPDHHTLPTLAGVDADRLIALHTGRTNEGTPPSMTTASPANSGPFRYGDRVQLTGPKNKLHTIALKPGASFHTHRGFINHDDLVGLPDGSVVSNSVGVEHLALRPLLSDFVMSMPRGAAIIYPKDAAQIIAQADIFPGARVVEAGVGSGALSMWLLRALGPQGRLFSFERREEFADVAVDNVTTFFGHAQDNWTVTVGDLAEALPGTVPDGEADRVVLDMLAPWDCIEAAADALTPGGVLLCYIATVTQLSRVAEAIRASGRFTNPQSTETMVRGWHVEGLAVRPEHRMIGHTGFLLTARRLADGAVLPELKRRASKSSYSDADVEIWTPGALGERTMSDKSIRKRQREAAKAAALSLSKEQQGPDAGSVPSGD